MVMQNVDENAWTCKVRPRHVFCCEFWSPIELKLFLASHTLECVTIDPCENHTFYSQIRHYLSIGARVAEWVQLPAYFWGHTKFISQKVEPCLEISQYVCIVWTRFIG